MKKVILLIEDDQTIALGITAFLSRQEFDIIHRSTIKEGLSYLEGGGQVDLILLDLNLPDGVSYDLCKYIKESSQIPVIFITVCDEEQQMVKGLDLGADDYITKPFSLHVLHSRVKAVLRRVVVKDKDNELICGAIRIHQDKKCVYCKGQSVEVSANEYKLLEFLMSHKNCTLSRAQILENMWDSAGNFVNDNTLTVTMKRLREKLGHPECIKTIRGLGYLMEDENA